MSSIGVNQPQQENGNGPVRDEIFGYTFNDAALLEEALTTPGAGSPNHRRLAFLGDRIVGMMVAEWLHKSHLDFGPRGLTNLINRVASNKNLASVARATGLKRCVRSRARSRKKKINRHTLANTLEAVAAAIFLDSGKCYATVSRVVVPLLFPDAAPARQVEKATEPVVTAEAPVLSVEDVERLSRLLDVATSLPPLPPSPNDLEEARAPDQGSPRTILELLNQVGAGNGHGLRSALNRRQILVQTVYRRLGVKPEFLVRAQDDGRGKAGKRQGNGQVVVDVQVRVGENTCLLGSGQGDSRQSAITDVATRLLANTRKLSHLLSHLQ